MSYEVMASVGIDKLVAARWNPRTTIDRVALEELQWSIEQHGIIEPLVVRQKGSAKFEVICGGRRLRCALALKLVKVPVVIREVDDSTALQLAVVENIQKANLHPLDEAAAYAALLKADKKATHASVGRQCGKKPAHVFKRCQLLKLHVSVRKVFAENRITEGHANRLTRVPVEKQEDALETCFHPLFRSDMLDDGAEQMEPAPVADLDEWIARHVKEEIDAADVTHVFPELALQSAAEHPEELVPTLIDLSDSNTPGSDLGTKTHGLVGNLSWTEIRTAKDECENQMQGVVKHGGVVRVLTICAKRGCPKHRPPKPKPKAGAKASGKPDYQVEQERQDRERQAWALLEPKMLAAFIGQVKDLQITPTMIEASLGHRQRGILKVLGVKKLTATNMGQAMAVSFVIGSWSQRTFTKDAKPFGFKPQATLAQHKRDLAAAAKPAKAKKTTKKKTAKGKGSVADDITRPAANLQTWNTCPECELEWKDDDPTPGVVDRTRLCDQCQDLQDFQQGLNDDDDPDDR